MVLGDGRGNGGRARDEIPGDPRARGIGFVIDTRSRLPSGSALRTFSMPRSTSWPIPVRRRGWRDVGRHRMGALTWLKLTALLTVAVGGVCWLFLGTGSGWFWGGVTLAAVAIEVQATRALAAEWSAEARHSWWWTR